MKLALSLAALIKYIVKATAVIAALQWAHPGDSSAQPEKGSFRSSRNGTRSVGPRDSGRTGPSSSQLFVDPMFVISPRHRSPSVLPPLPGRSSAAGRRRAGRSVPIPERTADWEPLGGRHDTTQPEPGLQAADLEAHQLRVDSASGNRAVSRSLRLVTVLAADPGGPPESEAAARRLLPVTVAR